MRERASSVAGRTSTPPLHPPCMGKRPAMMIDEGATTELTGVTKVAVIAIKDRKSILSSEAGRYRSQQMKPG